MYSQATIAAIAPFLLSLSKASPVTSAVDDGLVTSEKVLHAGLLPNNSAIIPVNTGLITLTTLGDGLDYNLACNAYDDWDCYQRWWEFYRYCHPYDRKCYRDCDNYDDYYGSCKSYNKNYGKCYDRCYYGGDNCDKYRDCHEDDSCYRKRRRDDYCYPRYDERYDEKCKDRHKPPNDYCKPYDYECHKKHPPKHGHPPHGPEYPPKYPPHKPEHPPKQPPHKPEYPPEHPPHKPEYPPKHPPHKPEYPPEQPPHEPEHPPKYPPPDYPPEHPPHKPEYPPEKPPHKPEQPPEYPPPKYPPEYPPKEPEHPPQQPPHKPEPEYPPPKSPPGMPELKPVFTCYPGKDKDCYPEVPDVPDNDDDGGFDEPHQPKGPVIVRFFNNKKGQIYEAEVWPNGVEYYTEKKDQVVDFFGYYAGDEKYIRCLAMKNWFPWNPLPIHSYSEALVEGKYLVRIIVLKRPQPIETIRCDYI